MTATDRSRPHYQPAPPLTHISEAITWRQIRLANDWALAQAAEETRKAGPQARLGNRWQLSDIPALIACAGILAVVVEGLLVLASVYAPDLLIPFTNGAAGGLVLP